MAFGRYFVPDGADLSVWTDPIRHPHDSQKRFSQETFHAPCTVRLDHFEFRVGEQRKSQFVFHLEFFLRFHGIAATAHDRGVQLIEFLEGVTKLGRFVDSTRSIRFRIKIKDHVFVAIVPQRNGRAAVVGYREARSLVAYFEHVDSPRRLRAKTPPSARCGISFTIYSMAQRPTQRRQARPPARRRARLSALQRRAPGEPRRSKSSRSCRPARSRKSSARCP